MSKLNSVKVMFDNPEHNYLTSVSAQACEKSSRSYFVGKWLLTGGKKVGDQYYRLCVDIKFINNNELTA